MIKKALSMVLIAVAASCQAAPPMPAGSLGAPYLDATAAMGPVAELGSTVEVRIDTGTTMQTKAARKTVADIDHYHVKLVNVATSVILVEGDTTNLVNFFHKVPNGTYKVVVDALDADGNSVVQGGAQDSLNMVTVASPNVTYSDDASCLKVRLKLLNATGEDVGSKIIVEDGDEFTGTPVMSPGGSCPCPSPSASGDVEQLPDEDKAGYIGVFGPDGLPDFHYRVNLGLPESTDIKKIEVYQSFTPLIGWSTAIPSWSPVVIYQNGVQRNTTYMSTLGQVGTPATWDIYMYKTAGTPNLVRITLTDGQVIDKPFTSVVQ
jgi:hypothetical protein